MANEILIATQLSFAPAAAGASPFRRDWQMAANQTPGTKIVEGIGTAGTAAATLAMGPITTPGLAFFKNLHATGSITIRNGELIPDKGRIINCIAAPSLADILLKLLVMVLNGSFCNV